MTMTVLQMLLSNIYPLRMGSNRYWFRKRLIHDGYQVLQKDNNTFIHIKYIDYILN